MLQFLRTYRNIAIAAALILVSSLIWISNHKAERDRNAVDRTVVWLSSPLVGGITWVQHGVRDSWKHYVWFVDLREDYDAALVEIQSLEFELNQLREQEKENERLRELLTLSRELGGKDLAAKVIGADDVAFARTIFINKGEVDGVRQNMPVITRAGVVGRVTKAKGGYSEVMLVTDPNSAIPIRIQRTRAQGILEGTGSERCRVKYVSRSEDVEVGDEVITAGLAGIFPPGVVVGEVREVRSRNDAVTQEVYVVPAVDFHRLPDEVLVLLESPVFPDDALDEVPASVAGGTR